MTEKSLLVVCTLFLVVCSGCSKREMPTPVIVEIPAGFNGNFVLEMGVRDAPPLAKRGDAFIVPVPKSGRVETSTLLQKCHPTFQNASEGTVWGFSQSTFATGDGIAVGGKIEFFVGTRKEYEAEQGKKKHSGRFSNLTESITVA